MPDSLLEQGEFNLTLDRLSLAYQTQDKTLDIQDIYRVKVILI